MNKAIAIILANSQVMDSPCLATRSTTK